LRGILRVLFAERARGSLLPQRRALLPHRQPSLTESLMRLFTTPASPWVRRCVVTAMELGIASKIEFVPTRWPHAWATQTVDFARDFAAATPVGRMPALVTDAGLLLADSFAISDYFHVEFGNIRLLPAYG